MENDDIAKYVTKNRNQYKKNPILVRHETGKVKKSCFDLPGDDFVFGKKSKKDKEGTREVVLSWKTAKLSPDKLAKKDFIRLNKKSLRKGICKNDTLNDFRKKNDIRVKRKNKKIAKAPLPSDSNNTHIYGRKGVKRTNARDLITNAYEADWKKKRDSDHAKKKAKLAFEKKRRKAMEKKNLYSKAKLRQNKMEKNKKKEVVNEEKKELFKMKKFANVKSRLRTQGNSNVRSSHAKYGLDILRK